MTNNKQYRNTNAASSFLKTSTDGLNLSTSAGLAPLKHAPHIRTESHHNPGALPGQKKSYAKVYGHK